MDDDRLGNVLALFEAYATDADARDAIDAKRFADLTGTTLPLNQYIAVPDEHRERIPGYVRAHLLAGCVGSRLRKTMEVNAGSQE